jgi:hypothetical protein
MQQFLEPAHWYGHPGIPNSNFIKEHMPNFNEVLSQILGVIFIIIVFSLAYAYLKPHRLHKSRRTSTLLLKLSYLFYLLVLLIIIYLSAIVDGGLEEVFFGIEFFAFLVVLFIPTVAVFARKLGKFSKNREEYNILFTIINVISTMAVIVMYFV